jgi:hypothetical protein
VVARGRADHSGRELVRRHLHQEVERSPQLVGADDLQVLALEQDLGADEHRQPFAALERRDVRDVAQPRGCRIDIRSGHGHAAVSHPRIDRW